MAEIPIAVIWDSRAQRLTVHPEFVKLHQGDTATWHFLSDDPEVDLAPTNPIDFDPEEGNPFGEIEVIAEPGKPKKCKGKKLKAGKKTHAYTVRLTNGVELDPGLRREPN